MTHDPIVGHVIETTASSEPDRELSKNARFILFLHLATLLHNRRFGYMAAQIARAKRGFVGIERRVW